MQKTESINVTLTMTGVEKRNLVEALTWVIAQRLAMPIRETGYGHTLDDFRLFLIGS